MKFTFVQLLLCLLMSYIQTRYLEEVSDPVKRGLGIIQKKTRPPWRPTTRPWRHKTTTKGSGGTKIESKFENNVQVSFNLDGGSYTKINASQTVMGCAMIIVSEEDFEQIEESTKNLKGKSSRNFHEQIKAAQFSKWNSVTKLENFDVQTKDTRRRRPRFKKAKPKRTTTRRPTTRQTQPARTTPTTKRTFMTRKTTTTRYIPPGKYTSTTRRYQTGNGYGPGFKNGRPRRTRTPRGPTRRTRTTLRTRTTTRPKIEIDNNFKTEVEVTFNVGGGTGVKVDGPPASMKCIIIMVSDEFDNIERRTFTEEEMIAHAQRLLQKNRFLPLFL